MFCHRLIDKNIDISLSQEKNKEVSPVEQVKDGQQKKMTKYVHENIFKQFHMK